MRSIQNSLMVTVLLITGCGEKIELVPPGYGQLVKTAEDTNIRVARYQGHDAQGNEVWVAGATKTKIPTGYFIVAPPSTTRPTN